MAEMTSSAFAFFFTLFFFQLSFAKPWTVPVLYWSMKIEGQVAMRKGFEEEINAYNAKSITKIQLVPYVAGEGRSGVIKQVAQFEEVLKKKPDAIVIQPTDNSALAKGLQKANMEKIPVIAYDQYIVNGDMLSFITSDNYQAGLDNGDFIDSFYKKNQEIRIAVFEYPRVSSTTDRVDGFFDSLRQKGRKFRVLRRYEAVDPESGLRAVQEFLRDFPAKGSVDMILTVNDGGGLTIVKHLLEKKRSEIVHATFDGDPQSVENIKQKRMTVIDSAQFCAELGRESARTLISHLKKEKVSLKKFIPTFPVTQKNVDSYPGWMGTPTQKTAQNKSSPAGGFRTPSTDPRKREFLNIKIGVAPLCPYICEQGPGTWGGYIYDILMDVARKNNFTVELESIPNTRLASALQSRRANYIIVPANIVRYLPDVRIARTKLGVSYTGALLSSEKAEPLIDEVTVQKRKVVFADLGSDSALSVSVGDLKATRLTGSDVADRMIKMIGDRRVDIALGDYNVLRYSLLRRPQTNLQLLPTSLTGFNSLVLVSTSKEPQFGYLPEHLAQWFEEARGSGQLEKVLSKYNLKDWSVFLSP